MANIKLSKPDPGVFERILWPTDFSDSDREALATAGEIARAFGGEIILFHVIGEPAEEIYGEKAREGRDRAAWALWRVAKDEAERRLAALADDILPGFHSTRTLASFGDAATRIVELVPEERIDLVVLSARREKSRLKEMLLGSVAYKVVRTAPCSVLIVK